MRKGLSVVGTLLVTTSLGGLTLMASGLADGALRSASLFLIRHTVDPGVVMWRLSDFPHLPTPVQTARPAATPITQATREATQGEPPPGAASAASPLPTTPPTPPTPLTPVPFRPITRIIIPRLSLATDVVPAGVIERNAGLTWEVPAFTAGHAEGTAGAGQAGNGVLVGHVSSPDAGNVFSSLGRVRAGDRIQVFSGAQSYEYQVVDVRTVPRTDVSVVSPTETASISLITCTGAWLPAIGDYAQRLVVRADLVDDEPAALPSSPTAAPPHVPALFHTIYDERPAFGTGQWLHDPAATAWRTAEGYRLFARHPGQFVALSTPVTARLRDVAVTATFRKVGGPPGGGYGIIARDQGPGPRDGVNQQGQYYVLEAGDRGEVGVWRREGDHWVDLLPWTPAEAVRPGGAANELTVQAIGSRLTLMVNGSLVVSLSDAALADGGVGIFVGGDLNEVVLDRFVLRVPG